MDEVKNYVIESPEQTTITFTDCKVSNLKFYGVDSVEIIVSPLPKRLYRRVKLWLFGGSVVFNA